ncbi:uncharacterized protein LOC129222969 [Uloborus diversus]|uniref:uncharacterized protein LOC129222969 n=1 Tax=Uloborus diversus TaxID=327109 RepID=UPI00240A6213|nr:uncharacterized protein LOC129222969 [Uloborus diversus]
MTDLPVSRVTASRAFTRVGIDFAGPFNIKNRTDKGVKITKCYVCLFVCFSTRAVDLEKVGDLTTKSYIATLKKFIARRGKPVEIHSDCGTNFKGASKELRKAFDMLRNDHLYGYLSSESIKWIFEPPAAPHFGGMWEAGIKSVKYLKRCLGNVVPTFEEFLTLITQIEACLNSRPLTPASSDPNELEALPSGHFLIGTSMSAIPEPGLTAEKTLTVGETCKRYFNNFGDVGVMNTCVDCNRGQSGVNYNVTFNQVT